MICTRCGEPIPNCPDWVHAQVDWCCRKCAGVLPKPERDEKNGDVEAGMTVAAATYYQGRKRG